MRPRSPQTEFGEIRPAHRVKEVVDELRLLAGENQMAPVARFIWPIERSTPRGALMCRQRLPVLGKGGTEDIEHGADGHVVHADIDLVAEPGLLPPKQHPPPPRTPLQPSHTTCPRDAHHPPP